MRQSRQERARGSRTPIRSRSRHDGLILGDLGARRRERVGATSITKKNPIRHEAVCDDDHIRCIVAPMRTSLVFIAAIASACGAPSGGPRLPEPAGAQMLFAQNETCPADRITVTARPDVPPHTILAHGGGDPPPEIASDPERMALWAHQHGDDLGAIDSAWRTFAVSGCNTQSLYVCQHPSGADFDAQNGHIVGDGSVRRDDGVVVSAVRCESNVKRELTYEAGVMGNINARMEDPSVPVLPLHTPLPTMPAALQHLRVFNTEAQRVGVLPAVCHGLGQKFDTILGWTPVEAGQPADIVLKSECFASANVSHGPRMFELLPLDRTMSISVSAPDGTLIEQFPPFPSTFACPTNDQPACSAALEEYAVGTMATSISQSQKILDYVTKTVGHAKHP